MVVGRCGVETGQMRMSQIKGRQSAVYPEICILCSRREGQILTSRVARVPFVILSLDYFSACDSGSCKLSKRKKKKSQSETNVMMCKRLYYSILHKGNQNPFFLLNC